MGDLRTSHLSSRQGSLWIHSVRFGAIVISLRLAIRLCSSEASLIGFRKCDLWCELGWDPLDLPRSNFNQLNAPYQKLIHSAKRFQIFDVSPNQKQESSMAAMYLVRSGWMRKLYKWPSIYALYQILRKTCHFTKTHYANSKPTSLCVRFSGRADLIYKKGCIRLTKYNVCLLFFPCTAV